MNIQLSHSFEKIVTINNLLQAWQEFLSGKKKKIDVQEFQLRLMDNILSVHRDLINKRYQHGGYHCFNINDPKPRIIHKASVRDRLLHYALYRKLYSFFDDTFIADSFSCRKDKGTHKAMNRFRVFYRIVSKNNTQTCWVLKCDIKKFFHSIDQKILLAVLDSYIPDKDIIGLLRQIISSFHSTAPGIGLPLGNLTSQLFCNIYMNEFDQFVKHQLKVKYYIRYADDFVILSEDRQYLENIIPKLAEFLGAKLKLTLHPDKVFIKTLASGVDFLGWVHFFNHRVLRKITKRKMYRKLQASNKPERASSYLGMLSHGNAYKVSEGVISKYFYQKP